ncbi:MAG: PrgI family protein [Candidatus Shapirobacteria bacterium]|jgi:hypothetical protein
MEQHAIPQQITSYEFKLVGDMTLKQFLKAAAGIILALLINSTKLMALIKWPLILLFAGGGLALAFVPYEDRPLDLWLKAFLRSIYNPTVYIFKKKKQENWLDIDLSKTVKANEEAAEEERRQAVPRKQKEEVKEFIDSLPSVNRKENSKEVSSGVVNSEEIIKEKIKSVEAKPADAKNLGEAKENADYGKANLDLKREKLGATGEAVFGEIPMPDIPELPNLIVGMVMNKDNKIVEGAIVEIQDKEGNPSRVLKTNQLGQFRTLTQLTNGKYLMVTEKDGFEFDRVEIILEGKIVKPIKIIAK